MSSAVGLSAPSLNFQFFNNNESLAGEKGESRKTKRNRKDNDRNQQRPVKPTFNENFRGQLESPAPSQFDETLSLSKSQPMANEALSNTAGSLLSTNPETLGFQPISHKPRGVPKYLIEQKPSLKPRPFLQDPWDQENQRKMLAIETQISDSTELWETFKKMREVERRVMEDKKLVDRADSAKDLNDAIVFQGTCQDMCPIFERARRSVENNVVRYEKEDQNSKKISRFKALKVFARPAAAAAPPLPSDVRPPEILVKTLDYIVAKIVPNLPDCEGFLWDRMRSIRQDFTFQNYSGPEAIDCNERIVRTHLLILHVMAKCDIEYSRQQELEQLHKALITLSEIYDEVRASGGQAANEAEFRAYSLLSRIRDPEYDKMAQSLPQQVFDDDMVQLALCFRRIVANSNYSERGHIKTENGLFLYKRFFQLLASNRVPFLMSSFLEVYVNDIRFYAMKSLSHTINKKHKPIPTTYLKEELLFNSDVELMNFCEHYSIEVNIEGIKLTTLTHHSHIIAEKKPLKQSFLQIVDEKLLQLKSEDLINCGKPNFDTIPQLGPGAEKNFSSPAFNPVNATTLGTNEKTNHQFNWNNNLETPQSALQNFADSHQFGTTLKFGITPSNNSIAHNVEASKQTEKDSEEKSPIIEKQNKIQRRLDEQRRIQKAREKDISSKQNQDEVRLVEEKKREEKSRKQSQLIATTSVAEVLVHDVVRKQVSLIAKKQLELSSQRKQKTQALVEELYQAFIHEKLYLLTLETKADKVFESGCLKHTWKNWKRHYIKKKEQREIKRARTEELARVSKRLGIPEFKRAKVEVSPAASFSYIIPSSSQSQVVDSPITNEERQFKTPVHKNTIIWKIIDLDALYLRPIIQNMEPAYLDKLMHSSEPIKIGILIFARNWNSVSSRWLLSKFGLQKSTNRTVKSSNLKMSLEVNAVVPSYSPRNFEDLQLLVFNSGVTENDIFDLEMKLKQDGEKLIELTHGIALNTNYQFSILVVYWESTQNPLSLDQIAKFLKLNNMSRIFANVLKTIDVVKLTSDCPHKTLEQHLAKVASSCALKLTERGLYNESLRSRSLLASSATPHRYQSSLEIDAKLRKALEQEERKHQQERDHNNTYAYLQSHVAASPRARKRKLPVLLSDSKKNKFKTPLAMRPFVKRTSSTCSTSSLASSEPSHLAAKIKTERSLVEPNTPWATPLPSRTQHNTVSDLAPLRTPSIAVSTSRLEPNTSGISNVTFESPFSTPTQTLLPNSRPAYPIHSQEASANILELKHLIASVKKNLSTHTIARSDRQG
ncbi:LANO_0H05138g1_1 [Lachancea nothofagi CBS 11611]|uniref:Nuclear mRNA export factor n=1 Tax=Lachancea nothofagi CBS 11611 TaxID=1266666 RepID=A0A1G4KL84_9SACH|nr:LANO_0H05138g1_1 [Lachancea nothofagi CBS 11611]